MNNGIAFHILIIQNGMKCFTILLGGVIFEDEVAIVLCLNVLVNVFLCKP